MIAIIQNTAYGWLMLAGIFVSIIFWSRLARRDERLVLIYVAALYWSENCLSRFRRLIALARCQSLGRSRHRQIHQRGFASAPQRADDAWRKSV
ncbi:MAG: hypothetical protein ACREFE_15215 [Limisphaerales bacterium]